MAYVYSIGADEALAGSHNCCAFSNAFDRDADKYWVGGAVGDTTNWHNPLNWAGSSGGAPGAGVPSINDNVYFDANSNSYACVATAAMECETFNGLSGWTNNFDTAGYSLTVNGYITITTTGTITFTNSTISLFGNLTIASALAAYNCGGVTWNFQSTGSYSVGKAQTGDYKKATIYSGARLSITVGAFTLRDDNQNDLLVLADSTSSLSIAGGSVVVLANGTVTPVKDNGGTISATTGYSFTIKSEVSGSVITTPKIDSGTNLLFNLQGSLLGGTFTFELGAPVTCRQFTVEVFGVSNATVNLNTNNQAITVGKFALTSNYGANVGTLNANFGSSVVTLVPYLGSAGNLTLTTDIGSTINLNTGTAQIIYTSSGDLSLATDSTISSITGNGTFEIRSGTYSVNTTFDCGGFTLPVVKVNTNSATYGVNFTTTLRTGRLLIEPNSIVRFKEGLTHTISSYTAGDWDGTVGNLVTIKSITDGQQHTLAVPTGISTNYVNVRDSVATNEILSYLTNGNVDSGNNVKWKFIKGSSWYYLANRRGR